MDLRVVDAVSDARIIVVGDIHGCYDELKELLDRIDPGPHDIVISAGDMVRKGPAAPKCLDLWRERGYLAVRGNNEIKLLGEARPLLRFFARDPVLRRSDLLRYIESWPLVVDVKSRGVAVVHGGFLPDMDVTADDVAQERDVVPELRWIRKRNGVWTPVGKNKKRESDVLWAEKWKGDRFVLYGHTPLREPRRDPYALGLDTGCVYGGALTAAILERRTWRTESVPARRKYA